MLGWSPKDNREVLTIEEVRGLFQIENVLRTNATVQFAEDDSSNQVDPKALWLNGQHLRNMPVEKLLPFARQALSEAGWWDGSYDTGQRDWFAGAINDLRSRLNLLTDFQLRCRAYFKDDFETEPKAKANLDKERVRELLKLLADRLEALSDFTEEAIETQLRSLAEQEGVKAGLLINGSRAALTGQPVGPSAFRVFTLVGQQRTLERLRSA